MMTEEFISRTEALEDFEANNARNPYWTPPRVKTLLLRQPTADVAEVVRCKVGEVPYKDRPHWQGTFCELDVEVREDG